ncbi:hypothetical protein BJV77DRAFT_964144 [Russula vinacea]|nr:hypothetical protein BJV77DRAFT_964144 [Russula vinacea]
MPKSWSKPYIALLKSRSDDWIDSKGRAEKKVIVQEILDHIEGTFGEDEEGPTTLMIKSGTEAERLAENGLMMRSPGTYRGQMQKGAQIFLMAAYEKPEISDQATPRDQFTEVMPMWKLPPGTCGHDGNESDSSANEKSNSKPEKIASFESHPTLGWPMLPKMGNKTSQECKDTMRAFVTETYRNFTRDSQAKVPWKDLSLDEQHELISKDSFPEDMHLLDPSNFNILIQKANARPLIFYASAAVNIRVLRLVLVSQRRHTIPPHNMFLRRKTMGTMKTRQNEIVKDDDEDDDEDEADNKKKEQEDGLPAENLLTGANGSGPQCICQCQAVILSMGLALQDINAAHFNEELPEDTPDWLKVSPLDINSAHRLSEIWGKQLQPAKPAMKAKAKANTRQQLDLAKGRYKKGKGSRVAWLRPSRLTLLMLVES